MPNAERAYATLDHIIAHPDQWNQRKWWCGTAGCFAGWTRQLAGPPMTKPQGLAMGEEAAILLGFQSTSHLDQTCEEYDVKLLFDEDNTLEDLKEIVETVFGPRP